MKLPSGEAVGGWATALALVIAVITSYSTYRSQDEFNKALLKFNEGQLNAMRDSNAAATKGLQLQVEAAKINREAAAVAALGHYLEKVDATTQAWASAEAIIDIAGEDPAWQATARRAIKMHPSELNGLQCELYSDRFLAFAAETFRLTKEKMCAPGSSR